MARVFAKVDANLHGNPKVMAGGREAREVFTFFLCTNWLEDFDGTIKPSFCDPRFVAAKLGYRDAHNQSGDPAELAKFGIDSAINAGLLARNDDGSISIVGFDNKWRGPKSVKKRVKEHRERKSNACNDQALQDVTSNASNACNDKRGEERRREEKRQDQTPASASSACQKTHAPAHARVSNERATSPPAIAAAPPTGETAPVLADQPPQQHDDGGNAAGGADNSTAQLARGGASETPDTAQSTAPVESGLPGEKSLSKAKRTVIGRHRDDAVRLWGLQNELRGEVIPGSRALKITAERAYRVAARLEAGATANECEAVLRYLASEAKKKPAQREWFNGATNWRPENFDRALGRVGDAPARDVRVGSVAPRAYEDYPEPGIDKDW